MKAVEVLMEHGVPEDRMIFINLVSYISSPKITLMSNFHPADFVPRGPPQLLWQISHPARGMLPHQLSRLVPRTQNNVQITGWIDKGLNEKAYIIPGLGDFGERRWASAAASLSLSLTLTAGTVFEQVHLGEKASRWIGNHG